MKPKAAVLTSVIITLAVILSAAVWHMGLLGFIFLAVVAIALVRHR